MILCMLLETTKKKKKGGGGEDFLLLCPGIKGSREVKARRTSFSVNDMRSEELKHCYGPDSPV